MSYALDEFEQDYLDSIKKDCNIVTENPNL